MHVTEIWIWPLSFWSVEKSNTTLGSGKQRKRFWSRSNDWSFIRKGIKAEIFEAVVSSLCSPSLSNQKQRHQRRTYQKNQDIDRHTKYAKPRIAEATIRTGRTWLWSWCWGGCTRNYWIQSGAFVITIPHGTLYTVMSFSNTVIKRTGKVAKQSRRFIYVNSADIQKVTCHLASLIPAVFFFRFRWLKIFRPTNSSRCSENIFLLYKNLAQITTIAIFV